MNVSVVKTTYSYNTLSNGLRCVHCHAPGLAEVCGVSIDAGSRDETDSQEGLAHFVEHTIFKGTLRRRAWHILNRMEAVGGELNAYTTKEQTTVYSVFPRGNLNRGLELIADLVANSQFPATELDKEREVVCDEIDTYLDMPSEAIFDEMDEIAFAGNRLAHNILGTKTSVAQFDSSQCREWLTDKFTARRMVVFYRGNSSADKFFHSAEILFNGIANTDSPMRRTLPTPLPSTEKIIDIDSHQAHNLLAFRVCSMFADDRYALALMSNILGGPGMNSLLNVELRERRGLVYTVESSTTLYTDCGLLSIYFGCDPDDTVRCRKIVGTVVDRLANTLLSERRLNQAKRQYIGQLTLASESAETAALGIGRSVLYRGTVATAPEVIERIQSITAEDIREQASLLTAGYALTMR